MAGFLKNALQPLGLKDDGPGTIFITSGTGVVGYRVAMGLLDAGCEHVRVGVWKGKRQDGVDNSIGQTVSEKLEAKGATVITFDWTNVDGYKMALAGANTVFCTLPHMNEPADTFNNFLNACQKEGVDHFVKTSFYEIPHDTFSQAVPHVRFHRECDAMFTQTKLNTLMTYTILCGSHCMSTPLVYQGPVLRESGPYVTASYAMGVNYVSPNDLAKVGIEVLMNSKNHRKKTYSLTGSKSITDKDVSKLLSKFYDKKLDHVAIGYHDIEADLKKRGFSKWLIKDLAGMEKVKSSGLEENPSSYTTDVETLIGKKAESFQDYLADTASMTLQENPLSKDAVD